MAQYCWFVSILIEGRAVLEQERVLAKNGSPALPKLLRTRITQPVATELAGTRARNGATVSIPVLTGLCRAAEIVLMAAASLATGLLLHKIDDVPPWGEFFIVSLIAIVVARAIAERQQVYTLPALLDPLGQLSRLSLGIVAEPLPPPAPSTCCTTARLLSPTCLPSRLPGRSPAAPPCSPSGPPSRRSYRPMPRVAACRPASP